MKFADAGASSIVDRFMLPLAFYIRFTDDPASEQFANKGTYIFKQILFYSIKHSKSD